MPGALPCPPAFAVSGRVRWSDCRSLWLSLPGPWLPARRLGEARRPVAASAWCRIWGRSARCAPGGGASRAPVDVRLGAGKRGAPLGAGQGSLRSGGVASGLPRASRSRPGMRSRATKWLRSAFPAITGRTIASPVVQERPGRTRTLSSFMSDFRSSSLLLISAQPRNSVLTSLELVGGNVVALLGRRADGVGERVGLDQVASVWTRSTS